MERAPAELIAWANKMRKQMTIFGRSDIQAMIVHDIKLPLVRAVNRLITTPTLYQFIFAVRVLWTVYRLVANKLPEPTKANTWHPNTHRLIDVRDYALAHIRLTAPKKRFLSVVSKFIIMVHDYDTPYRPMISKCVELLIASGWEHMEEPDKRFWKEDNNARDTGT